jgi:hypothetical protein
MRKACAFVLLFTALAMPARAGDRTLDTGNDFVRKCGEPASSVGMDIYCVAYALGVADGLSLGRAGNPPMWCIPPEIEVGQLQKVAISYMRRHPENLHYHVGRLLAGAFADAWPCR